MKLRNHRKGYGLVTIFLHWSMATLIIGLFFLGEYMIDLDYYDPWYKKAPDLHRSLGVLVTALLLIRWGRRLTNPLPNIEGKLWEQLTALWVHRIFYALIFGSVISGYLITTADGQPVSVFDWFEIPATLYGIENQEDIAGEAHKVFTYVLFFLATLHGLAAMKHHFINHDHTLLRMIRAGEK